MGEADDMEEVDEMDELDQMMKQGEEEDEGKKEMDELDQAMDELDQAEDDESMGGRGGRAAEQSDKQSRQPGKTVESVMIRLAAERKLQVEAKKKAQAAKQKQNEAQQKAKQKQKEAKQKQMEAQKKAKQKQMKEAQKAKDDSQKAQKEAQQKAKQAKQMKEAYDFFATKFNESVRRTARLQTLLAEASKRNGSSLNGNQTRMAGDSDNLRKKLAETNLFNMKLLYTNKLLQNESLTRRQKADVIERLDEAVTEREVKLVYESLVKTLTNKTNNLSEGATRVIGSSSAPTRSASTTVLNESYESDRWAKLAGIK
jgi:outer membrane biosynthesis protein TonB